MLLLAVFDAWYLHQHPPVPGTKVSWIVKRNLCRHLFGFIQWLTMHFIWLHIELAVAITRINHPKKSSPYTKDLHFLIYKSCLLASLQNFLSLKHALFCLGEQQSHQRENWFKCQWRSSKLKSVTKTTIIQEKKSWFSYVVLYFKLKIFPINFVIA